MFHVNEALRRKATQDSPLTRHNTHNIVFVTHSNDCYVMCEQVELIVASLRLEVNDAGQERVCRDDIRMLFANLLGVTTREALALLHGLWVVALDEAFERKLCIN